jgi:hypothetical protein
VAQPNAEGFKARTGARGRRLVVNRDAGRQKLGWRRSVYAEW